ncbi:MAG TPA: hypothetical protein VFR03_10840 [Thermoanaerobaculia bacterium]|nr:hypothetical protein [Thermoanaerobaculia bacterium]
MSDFSPMATAGDATGDRSAVDAPAARPALSGRSVPRDQLTGELSDRMFALLASSFSGVDRDTFQRDLAEKSCVVLLEDAAGVLRGFSTFLMYGTRAGGRQLTVVCSGDTIVEPAAWGSQALPRAWIRAVHEMWRGHPPGDLYWLLLTSGFRTYRFLPVFCRRFYPHHGSPTPPAHQMLLDALCRERFGPLYDRATGLVRFSRPQVLQEELLHVPAGRRSDPHVRFFLERNAGYLAGDELVSLASLADDNLTGAARRMMR